MDVVLVGGVSGSDSKAGGWVWGVGGSDRIVEEEDEEEERDSEEECDWLFEFHWCM